MRHLVLISMLLVSISCKDAKEMFLYDKDDPQYQLYEAKLLAKCIDESKSLNELKKTIEFDNYKVGDIYEYKFKAPDSNTYYIHFKIDNITSSDMTVSFKTNQGSGSGSNSDYTFTEKKLVFQESDAQQIYDEVSLGVCATEDTFLKAQSLTNTSTMIYSFNPSNYYEYTDSEFKTYKQRTGSFYIEFGAPSLLSLYNRSVTDKVKDSSSSSTVTTTIYQRSSLENLGSDDNECEVDCTFDAGAPLCNVTVKSNFYKPGASTNGSSGRSASQFQSLISEGC